MKPLWQKNEVTLHDGELSHRTRANRRYMMSLTAENLMRNYSLEAGRHATQMPPKDMHGGWESATTQLRGHFTGHWLSAAAIHFYTTGDAEVKARAEAMVAELAECQKDNGGEWAASIPEKYLDWVAKGKFVWAPQYTIHKTFMGLVDMYRFAGCQQALEVAENFANWFHRWAMGFSREEFDRILDMETGGMLEIWVQLYEITNKDMYRELMNQYYRGRLFDRLLAGEDALTNQHANTTIPEVLGCAHAYEVTGEQRWRDIAEAYWHQAVPLRGQYATGGQTCGEVWTPPMKMDDRLGNKNQEYCTVYNMMRLAEYLFRWTGDVQYADYWEQNLHNGIMAQSYWHATLNHGAGAPQGKPGRGLLTYFLPMMTGAVKDWSSETQHFFCCHGTMVQSNAMLNRGLYYQKDDQLYICQYFGSEANFTVGGQALTLRQHRDSHGGAHSHPDCFTAVFHVKAAGDVPAALHFRKPYWVQGEATLTLNGEAVNTKAENGFFTFTRIWRDGDTVRLTFPMGITKTTIPGNNNLHAFHYGPLTLAGLCAEAPALRLPPNPADLLVHDNEREWGSWKSTFRTVSQPKNLRFVPIKEIGYEPYTLYFEAEK